MPDVPYKNREIDEKFADIANALSRIEIQTTLTNGRVRWVEKMIWLAVGGLGVLTTLAIPIASTIIQSKL